MSDAETFSTVKTMAVALGRSEDYVTFMKKGGFKLPATKAEAIQFIRENGPMTRFRLYGHPPSPGASARQVPPTQGRQAGAPAPAARAGHTPGVGKSRPKAAGSASPGRCRRR